MSILLEGTWISHPHPTDGLCDVFPGKADLSQKSQFVPEQEERLRPFFSLPCLKHLKKIDPFYFFLPPLRRKADESILLGGFAQKSCLLQTRGCACLVVRSLRLYQPRRRDASEVADASAGLFRTQLAFAAPTAPLSLKTHLWGLFPALAPSPALTSRLRCKTPAGPSNLFYVTAQAPESA